jgi:hypothetical protein
MKRVFLIAFLFVFVTGCTGPGNDPGNCLNAVRAKFGENAHIATIPGKSYAFIVRDEDGDIYYVKTMNTSDTDITTEVMLIPKKAKSE